MKEFVAAARAEPALVAWLQTGLWRRSFDRGSLDRAVGVADKSHFRDITVRHSPGETASCDAAVAIDDSVSLARTEFFHTRTNWAVRAECTCQVGLFCSHSAALILLLMERISFPQDLFGDEPSVRPQPSQAISPHVQEWLKSIRKSVAAVDEPPAKPTKPEKRFLAFCIQHFGNRGDPPGWYFTLRVGTWLKSGACNISHSQTMADPTRPPKYMTSEDLLPVALYHQRRRNVTSWNEMRLKGGDWDGLFDAALATGRVFVGGPDRDQWTAFTAGPSLPVVALWTLLPDGDAVPALEFQDQRERLVLPTIPPRYFDRETNTTGTVTADLQPEVLASWLVGPHIHSTQVAALAKELLRVSPALPQLAKLETIELPTTPPQPHLLIRKTFVGGRHGLELIHALLRFSYNDRELLQPLSPREPALHHSIRGNQRFTQHRDPNAEAAAGQTVLDAGFRPISDLIRAHALDREMQHAFLLKSFNDQEMWLDHLASPAVVAMKDAGWVIDIDPASGLVVRDAGDLFPEIESDSAHGIEWFRFDAKFEIDGRELSLIPIIAAAIRRGLPPASSPDLPEYFLFPSDDPATGTLRFPARRLMEIVDQVRHLFQGHHGDGPVRIDRLGAAGVADALQLDHSPTLRALANLAHNLKNIHALPEVPLPDNLHAQLRPYQADGYRWLQFLAANSLHGILADDMGLGKTVQTLAHLAAEAEKFTPHLRVLTLHGKDRSVDFHRIPEFDLVITSYPLLTRDCDTLRAHDWHVVVLDEAQSIKNPRSIIARSVCQLRAAHRICLSGTPMENHLGELWSLMRFLMPGFLGDEKSFNSHIRRPIERDHSTDAQLLLNRRVSPLILRRTKDQVATELPAKTEIIHSIELTKKQTDLYESVRAAMDHRVREAIAGQGLAKSHIIVLDALLKLRQICCHPQLLRSAVPGHVHDSAKLDHLTAELLPTLLEENRRILLFSSFTSMLALIEDHLLRNDIRFLKLTGQTQDRASLVKEFQTGTVPIFLISLKAGGTGLNLTAADTVIHYDPWWNPAAENQATDRAHRIGQTKPVFVHKLVCRGTIEDRILELQKHKSALVEALLSAETSKLRIDQETLSHLLAPLD